MSGPSETAVPAVQIVIDVVLPDDATDEQRETFRRELEKRGAASTFILTIGLPATATPEQHARFAELMGAAPKTSD